VWLEHLLAKRGDLILLSHDTLGARYGFGEIKAVTKSGANIVSVTLDTAIDLPAGPGDLFSMGDLFGGVDITNFAQPGIFQPGFFADVRFPRDLFADVKTAAVAIRDSTGHAVTFPIQDLNGSKVLTFETPIPDTGLIVPGCIAAVGARGMATRRCLVFDVKRNDLETATVTLVDEAPEIHA
jgi:hypothetical protein